MRRATPSLCSSGVVHNPQREKRASLSIFEIFEKRALCKISKDHFGRFGVICMNEEQNPT